MKFVKKKEHIKRYKDLGKLLLKYGRVDLVQQLDLYDESKYAKDGTIDQKVKAEQLPNDLEKLGPTYIKLGQFLSTRVDLLPPEYLEELARLQDRVSEISYTQIENTIQNELGVRISKAFDSFDPKPLASASLAQVHRATLRDGRPVAVKVQREGLRRQILADLDAFDEVAHFLEKHTELGRRFILKATLEEFRKAILQELDFLSEQKNLSELAKNLAEFEHIVIPEPISDYSSSRVLTMEFIKGKKITRLSPLQRLDMNSKFLADELFRAYLKQILVDGFYHADPHPGNIFITENGCIALLDLGMVGLISPQLREQLLRLLLAIDDGNGEKAASCIIQIGEKLNAYNEKKFQEEISRMVSLHQSNTLEEIQIGKLVLKLTRVAVDNGVRLPSEFAMLGKTLLNLDRIGYTLDPEFHPNQSIRQNADDLFMKTMRKRTSLKSLYEGILDAKEFMEQLPVRLNKIAQLVANNELRINVNSMDERYLVAGLKEVTNRLVLGMILAALIVGAALMFRVETSFTIFGYPGIAIIFFLIAAFGGVTLAFRILFLDESRKKIEPKEGK